MTGEVLPFWERHKPSVDLLARIKSAKANIPEHDPHQDLLDVQAALVERIDAAERPTTTAASPLNDYQIKSLTYATERAAERGVGIYATKIRSWHQAIVVGAFVTGVALGVAGTYFSVGYATRGLSCQDQDGGIICYVWTRPPIQAGQQRQ